MTPWAERAGVAPADAADHRVREGIDRAAAYQPGLRSLGPAVDLLGVLQYTVLQSMFDAGAPHGRSYYVKSEWLDDLDDHAINELLVAVASMTSPTNRVLLRQMGGATARVAPGDTASAFRDAAHRLGA